MRAALALVVVFAFFMPAASSFTDSTDPGDAALYFTENPGEPTVDRWNFTTWAPGENDPDNHRQAGQKGLPTFVAHWSWFLLKAPDEWSIERGDEWEFRLHVAGLDETLPLPGNLFAPSASLGRHQIVVEVLESETVTASGDTEVWLQDVRDGVRTYWVTVKFHQDRVFTPDEGAQRLRIDLSITGSSLHEESALALHFDSSENPSRMDAPGYPVDALRDQEPDP